MAGINDGLTVKGGPQIAVKKVDGVKVDLKGRSPVADSVGDVCKASMAKIANPNGPRQGDLGRRTDEFPNNSKSPNGKPFENYPCYLTDSDAGN